MEQSDHKLIHYAQFKLGEVPGVSLNDDFGLKTKINSGKVPGVSLHDETEVKSKIHSGKVQGVSTDKKIGLGTN